MAWQHSLFPVDAATFASLRAALVPTLLWGEPQRLRAFLGDPGHGASQTWDSLVTTELADLFAQSIEACRRKPKKNLGLGGAYARVVDAFGDEDPLSPKAWLLPTPIVAPKLPWHPAAQLATHARGPVTWADADRLERYAGALRSRATAETAWSRALTMKVVACADACASLAASGGTAVSFIER